MNDDLNKQEQSKTANISNEVSKEELEEAWIDEFGAKYSKDKKKLLKVPDDIKEYNIRPGTLIIGDEAFSSCYSLQSVAIPNSVTQIGYKAFAYCDSLQEVSIPNSVTKMV